MNGGIHTFTGRMVDPLDLKPEDIDIEDIAHALSNQCRFSGHTRRFYSVAEHSIRVSWEVGMESPFRMEALLHDAAEAYLQDMARPLKYGPIGKQYQKAEERIEDVIAEKFRLVWPWPEVVKHADDILLVTEARDLMHGTEGWDPKYTQQRASVHRIVGWAPYAAEEQFLMEFARIEAINKRRDV